MSKFVATYEFKLDCGEIPDEVMAELLKTENNQNMNTIWEYGDPKLIDVKPDND